MSCSDDDDPVSATTSSSELDKQLEEALMIASEGEGMNFYIFPESDDYSNIPQDPNNLITEEKCRLGKLLFHETGLAVNPKREEGKHTYSCASCHNAGSGFQSGRAQGIGEGGLGFGFKGEGRTPHLNYDDSLLDIQSIRVPTNLNVAYQRNVFWNGQLGATDANAGTEGLWVEGSASFTNHLGFLGPETQAIIGLTEHRMDMTPELAEQYGYKEMFDAAFPDYPESERYTPVTAGLAIACYERTLLANRAGFQKWLRGNKAAMSDAEKRGALIFFGNGECSSCHNGPALSTLQFAAIGMGDLTASLVRSGGSSESSLGRGGFTGNDDELYAFKVPQLYNLKDAPFFGHGSTFTSLRQVIEYKNRGVAQNANVTEKYLDPRFKPLNLSEDEVDDLVKFLEYSLWDEELERYIPSSNLSGFCFPNNDEQSKFDLGCDPQ